MIKKTLWVSGVLAAIAVLSPGSVVLGLYLGIVPGLILAVAPTIFLYTGAFALLRNVLRGRLPTRGRIAINAAAAALTVTAGFALAAPAALAGRRAVPPATKNDVTPPPASEHRRRRSFGSVWRRLVSRRPIQEGRNCCQRRRRCSPIARSGCARRR